MAIYRKSTTSSRRSFKPSPRKFLHRPQLGLNCGFDVRSPAGTLGFSGAGGASFYFVTDKGNPIVLG